MKKLLVICLLLVFLVGCGTSSREIAIVQNGQFYEFDFTVGEMVNSNWQNVEWEVIDGNVFVSGDIDNEDLRQTFTLEFSVNTRDSSFDFERLFIDGVEADDFSAMMILTIMSLTTTLAIEGDEHFDSLIAEESENPNDSPIEAEEE